MALNFRESIQSADPFDLLTSYKVNQPARKSCQVRIYKKTDLYCGMLHNLCIIYVFIASFWRRNL